MSKIDLTSLEWCELVFEGKNKEYGAYELRQDSTRRHYIALIIVLVSAVVLFFLPALIEIVIPKSDKIVVVDVTELSNLQTADEKPDEQQIKPEELPPPPLVKEAIKFTVAEITKQRIPEEEEMIAQEVVTQSTATIANITQEGSNDPNAVDVDQLNQIAQVPVEEKPYTYVEQMPTYPGGETEMRAFISKNLRYPTIAQENGIQGKVYVRFVISKTGEVTNVEVVRGIDPICDKEAVRVIKLMPKWVPGKQNGNAVPVIYTVPVVFKLI